jgi:hypothetical protein
MPRTRLKETVMVIEVVVAVSLVAGFALGYYAAKRGLGAVKAEFDLVITKAERMGKTEIASAFRMLKAKL